MSDPRADRQDRNEDAQAVGGGTIWARVMGARVPPRQRPKGGPTPDEQAAAAEEPVVSSNA